MAEGERLPNPASRKGHFQEESLSKVRFSSLPQLKLIQSELNVEEVVNDRSWKV